MNACSRLVISVILRIPVNCSVIVARVASSTIVNVFFTNLGNSFGISVSILVKLACFASFAIIMDFNSLKNAKSASLPFVTNAPAVFLVGSPNNPIFCFAVKSADVIVARFVSSLPIDFNHDEN